MKIETWLRQQELKAYPESINQKVLPRAFVEEFLRKATMFEEMMGTGYIESILERVDGHWTEHGLRQTAILDYPASALEPAYQDHMIPLIRKIKTGLYPLRGFSARALVVKNIPGRAIQFSEWLFTFLSDIAYSKMQCSLIADPESRLAQWSQEKQRIKGYLYHRTYSDLSVSNFATSALAPRFKVHLAFSLFFVWAHEIAHHLLGHLKDRSSFTEISEDHMSWEQETNHEREFDADMVAFDTIVRYSEVGFAFGSNELDRQEVVFAALEYFRIEAELSMESDYKNRISRTHPFVGMRLVFMCLRHEELYRSWGMGKMVDELLFLMERPDIPAYDYTKELGSGSFLR